MRPEFDQVLAADYTSRTQIARVLTEDWCQREMYCVACDNTRLRRAPNNSQGVDFDCATCDARFQLKAGTSAFRSSVPDGAYATMLRTITSPNAPHFLLLTYAAMTVRTLTVVPSFFLTANSILERPPLPPTARRAGWVGCTIHLRSLPAEARIPVVIESTPRPIDAVRTDFARFRRLEHTRAEARGWTVEVLKLVNQLPSHFTLADVYAQEPHFQSLFPGNRHVRDKLRQQLQILRDAGTLTFEGRGQYRKLP